MATEKKLQSQERKNYFFISGSYCAAFRAIPAQASKQLQIQSNLFPQGFDTVETQFRANETGE